MVNSLSDINWQEFLSRNLGKILGVLLGLALGWMIIHYGFFKSLFIIAMVIIGYIFGKNLDEGASFSSIIDRIFKR